jgi:hypothetical protein
MLTQLSQGQAGHTILEALVATAITSLISVGLWQLVHSARTLANARFDDSQPLCEIPHCSDTPTQVLCTCGQLHYVTLR